MNVNSASTLVARIMGGQSGNETIELVMIGNRLLLLSGRGFAGWRTDGTPVAVCESE